MWRKQQSHCWQRSAGQFLLTHRTADLAPTDYHLAPDMQRSLEGADFKTKSEAENWLVSYFCIKKARVLEDRYYEFAEQMTDCFDKEVKYY
uniref:Uncharacterized protein n=1 Tax=Caenorhabditis japonica TaxID=281687 RepID=A0A8R1EAQ9_CAEJA